MCYQNANSNKCDRKEQKKVEKNMRREKDEERKRKEVTAKRKKCLSVTLLLLNYSSHSGH